MNASPENYPHGIRVDSCAHLQCDRPRKSHQLCESHYMRLNRGQEIASPLRPWTRRPPRPRVCAVYRCAADQFLDLLCVRHWRMARLGRLPQHANPTKKLGVST